MFSRIGPFELVLILTIALIVFGPRNLPEVGRSLGKAIASFRKASNELELEFTQFADEERGEE